MTLDTVTILSQFKDPLLPETTNGLVSLVEFPPGKIAVAGVTYSVDVERRGLLTKIDIQTRETQIDYIDIDSIRMTPYKLINYGENLLALGYGNNTRLVDGLENATFGIFCILYDDQYNKLHEALIGGMELSGSELSAVVDDENSIIITASEFRRDTTNFETGEHDITRRYTIIKLDSNFNVVWKKSPFPEVWDNNRNIFLSIVKSHVDNGYIIVGTNYTDDCGFYFKINNEGELDWYRTITSLEPGKDDALDDVIPTSDGYYAAAGYRFEPTENDSLSSVSQVWLIKFDENGDIVDLSTSTTAKESLEIDVRVFPNPTSDIVYIQQKEVQDLSYNLYDSSGKLLMSRKQGKAHHTYTVDVSSYQPGLYYLKCIDNNSGKAYIQEIVVE